MRGLRCELRLTWWHGVIAADVEGGGRRGCRRRVRKRRAVAAPGCDVDHLSQAFAHRLRRELRIFGSHVGVAHQHHRFGTALPGEHLQAVLVVVVVRALALRCGAPGACDVAGGEHVLQKVQRERLVGQRRACQRLALRGIERLVGQAAGLLQRAQVKVGVDADRADVRAGAQRQLGILDQAHVGARPRRQKVRVVRARARRVLRVGALQTQIGRAQCVDAFGAQLLVGHTALRISDEIHWAQRVHCRPVGRPHRRCHRNARQVDLQLRGDVGNLQDPGRRARGVEHGLARARMVARNRTHRGPVDARRRDALAGVGTGIAQARFVADAGLAPKAIELGLAFGIEPLHGEQRQVAMLGVDPCLRRCGCGGQHGCDAGTDQQFHRADATWDRYRSELASQRRRHTRGLLHAQRRSECMHPIGVRTDVWRLAPRRITSLPATTARAASMPRRPRPLRAASVQPGTCARWAAPWPPAHRAPPSRAAVPAGAQCLH